MAYVPNPADPTQPVASVLAETAAAEFRALKAYIQTIVSGGGAGVATPGMVALFPGTVPLPGWLELNGSLQNRIAFAALWANAQALGNVVAEAAWSVNTGAFSSGDGSTTFRLPDYRGVFVRGFNNGRTGINMDTGRVVGTLQQPTYVGDNGGNGGTIVAPQSGNNLANTDDTNTINATYGTIAPTGGAGGAITAKSVRPVNVPAMYCIKT